MHTQHDQRFGILTSTYLFDKKDNIKAYDDEEQLSKGVVILPVQVGPITTNITF